MHNEWLDGTSRLQLHCIQQGQARFQCRARTTSPTPRMALRGTFRWDPTSQAGKLRHREARQLVQSHTACMQQSQGSSPGSSRPGRVLSAPGPLPIITPRGQ